MMHMLIVAAWAFVLMAIGGCLVLLIQDYKRIDELLKAKN